MGRTPTGSKIGPPETSSRRRCVRMAGTAAVCRPTVLVVVRRSGTRSARTLLRTPASSRQLVPGQTRTRSRVEGSFSRRPRPINPAPSATATSRRTSLRVSSPRATLPKTARMRALRRFAVRCRWALAEDPAAGRTAQLLLSGAGAHPQLQVRAGRVDEVRQCWSGELAASRRVDADDALARLWRYRDRRAPLGQAGAGELVLQAGAAPVGLAELGDWGVHLAGGLSAVRDLPHLGHPPGGAPVVDPARFRCWPTTQPGPAGASAEIRGSSSALPEVRVAALTGRPRLSAVAR